MHCGLWLKRASGVVLLMASLAVTDASGLAQEAGQTGAPSLAEALRALQARGLRVVFSSATVTPDLRVLITPRASSPRKQLDELLAPHGLAAREGPGGTLQVVRAGARPTPSRAAEAGAIGGEIVNAATNAPLGDAIVRVDGVSSEARSDARGRFLVSGVRPGARRLVATAPGFTMATRTVQVTAGTALGVTLELAPAMSPYQEYVAVNGSAPQRRTRGVAAETAVTRGQLDDLHGSLDDDPYRVVHTFAGVAPVDEFHSEFVVRGSPFRHADVVVDGVSTHWLLHTAYSRGATGSLAMFPGHVLEEATLSAGAYPRRYGDRLGPQLDLTIREGSRTRFRLRGSAGLTNAAVVGEGPVGRAARGSWLVAARQSFVEWPAEAEESERTAFGYFDGLAKLVYDVAPTQQVAVSLLGGTSQIDTLDNLAPHELAGGSNRAAVVNLSWRSHFASGLVLSQRAYLIKQQFFNKRQSGQETDRGKNEELVYRAHVTRPFRIGLLEAGAQVGRSAIDDVRRSGDRRTLDGASWLRTGYAHFAWAATPALTLSPGLRITSSTLQPERAVSRWLLGEWTITPAWTLNASGGISQQLPEMRHVLGEPGGSQLSPERARQVDAGIEHRLTTRVRWRATIFTRREDDILREPETYPRLSGGLLAPPAPGPVANALQGTSHGVELVVERRSPTGLSGWVSYAYGRTRQTDTASGETFPGDFDQPHALSLLGTYRLPTRTVVGATLRAASNFPIPGYLTARGGSLWAGADRNTVRLPIYARLDLRASHGFDWLGGRLTVHGEALNVLNRTNLGLTTGHIDSVTGEAIGFTDPLLDRRLSAGIAFEY
jgi:hypothetical protein